MTYVLFIDDGRQPIDTNYVVVRNYNQAVACVKKNGRPSFISFDHDLGEEKSGYDIAKKFCDMLEGKPLPFGYYVHSQNPIGKKNIETYLANYHRFAIDTNQKSVQ